NELGKSHADIRTAQSGKLGSTDDTKWQISVSPTSRWANRFIIAAIVQGALAAGVTSYLLYDAVYGSPGPARIVAGGSAGTWLTVGYLGYIMLGPLAAAVTALFYQHLEVNLRAPYKGWPNALAGLRRRLETRSQENPCNHNIEECEKSSQPFSNRPREIVEKCIPWAASTQQYTCGLEIGLERALTPRTKLRVPQSVL